MTGCTSETRKDREGTTGQVDTVNSTSKLAIRGSASKNGYDLIGPTSIRGEPEKPDAKKKVNEKRPKAGMDEESKQSHCRPIRVFHHTQT
jgi:hypothetical protein